MRQQPARREPGRARRGGPVPARHRLLGRRARYLRIAGRASTAPTTTAAATASAAAPLTGTQLAARLEPASWFPAGTHGQGKTVSRGAAAQTPLPPIVSGGCVRLGGPDAVDLSKVGSLSFAWNRYAGQGTGTTYAQQIDVDPGTSASRVMARLRQLATTCASFQEPGGDGTMTVHLEPGPKLGDDALILELSDAPVGEALEAWKPCGSGPRSSPSCTSPPAGPVSARRPASRPRSRPASRRSDDNVSAPAAADGVVGGTSRARLS